MANQNQREWVAREKLGRPALKLTLICQDVTLKFVAGVVFAHCWESASIVNFLVSPSKQANQHCKNPERPSPYTATESSKVDYYDCVDAVVHA